jgi:DNA invertase Pin-like site-specific DNA recombinase
MRIAAYLRVSTDAQAEHGLGLDIQEQAIRKWAKANGHKIVDWYRDEGVSGSNGIDSRTALPDALAAIKDSQAVGLAVYRLDRLARDLIIQETLLAEIRRMGGDVYTTSAAEAGYLADDPDDPSRKLIRQVLGAVAEYERSMIALRLRSGRKRKAERGGFAYGSPRYGYRAEGGQLVPEPAEQAVLARIRELRAGGLSVRMIADTLTSEGLKPKRGGEWHPETIRRILARAAN